MQLGAVLREIHSIAISHNDDLVDRYNHRFTVIFLSFFILVIASKQYYGEPIVCWTPAHFSGAHNHYTNTIWYLELSLIIALFFKCYFNIFCSVVYFLLLN